MSDWDRLREIVEDGAEVDPAARAAWLDEACGGDASLRKEAEELIAASLQEVDYLAPPRPPPAEPVLGPETRVGAYRLVRPIASGGMGTVYEAERADPHRRVALKVMRAGFASAASVNRFRFEVEVLASLQHPSIAHMYETGVYVEQSNGRRELPWFAMEFVADARSITDYLRGRPVREQAALFADVCDAVHHGHAKGVLHRDLKPDNILVDGEGRPKVIDFGVARSTDSDVAAATLATTAGEIVGTLAYMSPEQVAGRREALDTRSDVYSLGVVFYQCLAGAMPYALEGCDLMEVVHRIHHAAPGRLPGAPADVETIVRKCLAKEPDRRYSSAAALAADLRRYLAHEPIEAHPPSLAYQVRLFARRNRALVATGCLVFAVSVAAAIVSLLLLGRARDAEQTAVRRGDEARSLFEALLQRSVDTTVRYAPRLHRLPGGGVLTVEMVEATIRDLEVLREQAGDDPAVLARIAKARLQLGEVLGDPTSTSHLGDRKGAAVNYGRALELTTLLHARRPGDDAITRLHVEALRRTGMMESMAREFGPAQAKLTLALALAEDLHARNPGAADYQYALIRAHGRMSEHLYRAGDKDRSARHEQQRYTLSLSAYDRWPTQQFRRQVVGARGMMARRHVLKQDFEAALRECEAVLSLADELVAAQPDDVIFRFARADNLYLAGACNFKLMRLEEAIRHLGPARDAFRELRTEDPDNRRIPSQLGTVLAEIGGVEYHRSKAEGVTGDERRAYLQRAADAFHESWQVFLSLEKEGEPHGKHRLSEMIRTRYEGIRAMLDD